MANEPNNADEQLKQYAAERRQQVPQEIHPATRNILQGEVRRTYGSPEEERRARVRLRWMQALAWLVIAAAIPLFLLPRNPKENVNEALPAKPGEVTLPTEKKRGEAPIVLSDTKEPVAPVVVTPRPSGPQPQASPPITTREHAREEPTSRALKLQERRAATAKDEVATAAAGANNLFFANNVSNQPILNRFRFEQTGARVKIAEADGSVYPGRVVSQQGGNDIFQAAGVSQTLNRAVVVTGQVTRVSSNVQQQQAAAANNSQIQNQNVLNNASSNSAYEDVRVQGQAIIGNTQYKVDAQVTPAP